MEGTVGISVGRLLGVGPRHLQKLLVLQWATN